MSSFRNLLLVAAGVVLLSACGFTPMYGGQDGASIVAESQNVEIDNIPDRDGQQLRNLLIDRLYTNGTPREPAYILKVTELKRTIDNIGIRKDATATRGEMMITAKVRLVDRNTGSIVLEREMKASGAYNLLDNQFATLVSKESLTDHVLGELSDSIATELGLYFNRAGK